MHSSRGKALSPEGSGTVPIKFGLDSYYSESDADLLRIRQESTRIHLRIEF
jgi:hypothetical protein